MTDFDKKFAAILFWPTAAFGVFAVIMTGSLASDPRLIFLGALLLVISLNALPQLQHLSKAQQLTLGTLPVAGAGLGGFVLTGELSSAHAVATAVMAALVGAAVLTDGWSRRHD